MKRGKDGKALQAKFIKRGREGKVLLREVGRVKCY